jgi:hypothetical protein
MSPEPIPLTHIPLAPYWVVEWSVRGFVWGCSPLLVSPADADAWTITHPAPTGSDATTRQRDGVAFWRGLGKRRESHG